MSQKYMFQHIWADFNGSDAVLKLSELRILLNIFDLDETAFRSVSIWNVDTCWISLTSRSHEFQHTDQEESQQVRAKNSGLSQDHKTC